MSHTTLVKLSISFSLLVGFAASAAVFYAKDAFALRGESPAITEPTLTLTESEPSPATIAAWKASARASDSLSPQVPF